MAFEHLSITSVMSKDVKVGYPKQTIREVCKSMHDYGIGSIVIVEGNNDKVHKEKAGSEEVHTAVGIVTERDIVSYLGSDRALSLRTNISEIMSTPLITVTTSNSVKDAIETMQLRNIRRLPVTSGKDNKMAGIVTDKDILRAITKTAAGESLLTDQMQFGYRFMYERFVNDDFPKGPSPGIR
jgi:CBS domain-containing protein